MANCADQFENKIEKKELEIVKIANKIKAFNTEKDVILQNRMLSKKDGGSNVAAIKEAAAFYRIKLNEISNEKLKLQVANKRRVLIKLIMPFSS